ncbi:MAG TPA: hypothetical protein VFJ83_11115 [Nocardioidaceae bacterium]|nr:hypothetical protein [Nocardioidaceae bacterium]
MAFSRETAAGVSEDMVRPAAGVERANGGVSGLVGGLVDRRGQGLVAGRGQDLTAAEAASG